MSRFSILPALIQLSLIALGSHQEADLCSSTRIAIEAYDSSLASLQFRQYVSFDGEKQEQQVEAVINGTVTSYAEDAKGRRALDFKVVENAAVVFRDAAFFDGTQGYRVSYDESNPERIESVAIEHHWAGDAAQIGLPYALQFLRWAGRQQPWQSYAQILSPEVITIRGESLEIVDSPTRPKISIFPDRAHAYLPARVTRKFDDGTVIEWNALDFQYESGRWFPVHGTVEAKGKQAYKHYWYVRSLQIGAPVSEDSFRPSLTQSGLTVHNRITGQTYVVGGKLPSQESTHTPAANSEEVSEGMRVSPPWRTSRVVAYVLGTGSLATLLFVFISRLRARPRHM